jgi:glycosyltransferase involved in cell wall biosynthesis
MCPQLSDLPPPPPGKTGFPWTVECSSISDSDLPRISVVTPSFQQAEFLEETIRSVLLQGYPNLEYLILDGGSADGSVAIIRKYERWLAHWYSAPDRGQPNAVQAGWASSSGEILAYLNSDDTYLPNALITAARALRAHPHAAAICGGELLMDARGWVLAERPTLSATLDDLLRLKFLPQPAMFLRRAMVEQAGGIDPQYQTAFDFDLWIRVAQVGQIYCVPQVLATTRLHWSAKTLTRRRDVARELEQIITRALDPVCAPELSEHKRRALRANLHRVLVAIYLEDFPTNARQAWAHTQQALSAAPLSVFALLRTIASSGKQKMLARLPSANKNLPWNLKPTHTSWTRWSPGTARKNK